jgi:hypothetical protein
MAVSMVVCWADGKASTKVAPRVVNWDDRLVDCWALMWVVQSVALME